MLVYPSLDVEHTRNFTAQHDQFITLYLSSLNLYFKREKSWQERFMQDKSVSQSLVWHTVVLITVLPQVTLPVTSRHVGSFKTVPHCLIAPSP